MKIENGVGKRCSSEMNFMVPAITKSWFVVSGIVLENSDDAGRDLV